MSKLQTNLLVSFFLFFLFFISYVYAYGPALYPSYSRHKLLILNTNITPLPPVVIPTGGGGGGPPAITNASIILFYGGTYYTIGTHYPLNVSLWNWKQQYNIQGNVTVKVFVNGTTKWYMISDDGTILELFGQSPSLPTVEINKTSYYLVGFSFLLLVYISYYMVKTNRKNKKWNEEDRKKRDKKIKKAVRTDLEGLR